MRNLTLMLGVLLVTAGCARRPEAAPEVPRRAGGEAAVDAGQPAPPAAQERAGADAGGLLPPTEPERKAGDGGARPTPGVDAGAAREEGKTAQAPTPAGLEACVDRWLETRGLDRYGHPAGTMYAGGTPLFDERTGESKDRLTYVFTRQPDARTACRAAGSGPDAGRR